MEPLQRAVCVPLTTGPKACGLPSSEQWPLAVRRLKQSRTLSTPKDFRAGAAASGDGAKIARLLARLDIVPGNDVVLAKHAA